VVVEPAPSHDGAPSFAAYEVPVSLLNSDAESEDGYSSPPPAQEPEKHRPKFGIRIYERAALLARRISELTDRARMSGEGYEKGSHRGCSAASACVRDGGARCHVHLS
jgi:hypothetical protein